MKIIQIIPSVGGKKRKKERVIRVLWVKIVQIISLSVQAQGQITFTCVFPFSRISEKKLACNE